MNPLPVPPWRHTRSILRTQNDDRLTALSRCGSDAAFEVLVVRYRRSLVRQCRRVVGEDDAEEAVQNALLRAHRALVRGDDVHNVGAWLHAIAANAALNVARARNARPEYPHDGHELHDEHDDDRAQRRQEFREVITAVQSLPPRQRDAIVMRELEGRSYGEIAAALGTSSGAVRQLLHRGRRALRDRLGAITGAEPLLRWLMEGSNGPVVARFGGLSGGCAVTAKICAAALLPATILGVAGAPAEKTSRPRAHPRAIAHVRRHSSTAATSRTEAISPASTTTTLPAELWRSRSTPPNKNAKVRVQGPGIRPEAGGSPSTNSLGGPRQAQQRGVRPSEDPRRGSRGVRKAAQRDGARSRRARSG